ncbi:YadA-like C-terminal domain protein [Haemophilus parainfluenzae ATCC 33392]|uniref:YadA-like family protein n=1 Tax=Haemophilus parainfluenzae ATCC 33392 TaxID=888828 RepID=A0ABD7ZI22_HAEPA|nr:YadA-like family protein [Haemophilus parainfluenzae]EGC72828.1 Hep/Hag repeat protein [Haemophilus parainfluenzae ATCC 33392]KFL99367.1 YadA-like C-terminal domain protein [Haemophilus parainfluenzae ATCC 33392]QQB22966.1 YadA-like family protein [Haemophilus parainfluenzae]WMS24622.1 YadA-like family protein [Haemophilus parainfluenzae ATCC 33392]STO94654.1 Adhesin yadA precursor [Haemophilus parainfluenzae ATCC 33392]
MIGLVGRKVGVTRIFKEDGVSVAVATALLVLGSAMPGTVMAAPFKASASAIQPSNEHFVSVAASHRDADITKEANYDNKAAKAPGSVAIGSGASVAFEDKNGEGYGAREGIAIGQNATVKLVGAVCNDCEPEDPSSEGSISIGRDSVSGGRGATSIGLGANSEAHGVSIGINATTSFSSVAIGVESKSSGKNAVAMGSSAKTEANNAIAIGNAASAKKQSDLAVGDGAKALNAQGSAFGVSATASGNGATAIGGVTSASGWLSTSIGYLSKSAGNGAYAGGASANANGEGAVSVGQNSTSTGTHTAALGASANASAEAALALGASANASHANAVALGANSVTKAAVASNEATVNGVYYSGFAANNTASVVSLGDAGKERQLVNVAAGQISATSTDAINGSQLYLVASGLRDQMPVVYTTVNGKKAVKKPDGKFYELDDAGNVTSTVVPNADVIASMNDGNNSVTSPMTLANIKSTLPDTFSTTINPKDNSAATITKTQAAPVLTPSQYNYAATLGDVLNAGWNLQANGSAVDFVKPYDTVNFASEDGTVEITPTTNGSTSTLDFKVKHTDLTVNEGKVVAPDNTNGSKFVNATTVANTVNNSGWKLGGNDKTAAGNLVKPSNNVNFINGKGTESAVVHNAATGDSTVTFNVKPNGTSINVTNDGISVNTGNITAAPTSGNDAGKVTVADTEKGKVATVDNVAEAINSVFWKVGDNEGTVKANVNAGNQVNFINGDGTTATVEAKDQNGVTKVAYNVAYDNDTIVKDANGKLMVNKSALPSVKVENTDNTITVTPTTNGFGIKVNTTELSNTDGKVTTPTDGDKLVNATTVANAINNSGWKATATANGGVVEGTSEQLVKPGETVNYIAGKNIKLKQNGANFTVSTTENVTFTNANVNSTLTVGEGNNATQITSSADGMKVAKADGSATRITNVAAGVNPTDAVNVSQLKAAKTNVVAGNQVNVTSSTGDNKQEIYTVNVNTTALPATVTDANKPAEDGKLAVPTEGGLVTASDVANAINATYWKVGDNAGVVQGKIGAGNQVNFVNGNGTTANVAVENGQTNVSYDVNVDGSTVVMKEVTDPNNPNKKIKQIAGNYIGQNGITVKGNVIEAKTDGKTVTVNNDGALTVSDDVMNNLTNFEVTTGEHVDQFVANTAANSKKTRVKPGDVVTYASGKNIAIKQEGTTFTISTTENATFTNANVGNTLTVGEGNNATQITSSADGMKVAKADGSATRITNVAAGVNPTDAVNVSQLGGLKNDIHNMNNRLGKVNREARAGVAGANAAASLPQVYIPGKSMVAAAGGTFKGQNAFAVGYSRSSDNGKLILKLQGNANTQGDVGGGVGIGYQW